MLACACIFGEYIYVRCVREGCSVTRAVCLGSLKGLHDYANMMFVHGSTDCMLAHI